MSKPELRSNGLIFKEASVCKTSRWRRQVSYQAKSSGVQKSVDQRLKFKNLKKGGRFPATVDRGENGFGDFLADDQIFDGRRGETR